MATTEEGTSSSGLEMNTAEWQAREIKQPPSFTATQINCRLQSTQVNQTQQENPLLSLMDSSTGSCLSRSSIPCMLCKAIHRPGDHFGILGIWMPRN